MALFFLLSGCASGPNANPRDPLEPFNRGVSRFNDVVDKAILKPAATAYVKVTPALARTGVRNFFSNLGDAWSAVNSALQFKAQDAAENWMHFSVNTVFGLGGLLDVAGEIDIPRHKEDFGRTLGRWGVPAGPYLVLPLLGPSTVRDAFALPVDAKGNLIRDVHPTVDRNSLYVLEALSLRANLLRASSVLDDAALDKYSFTRDIFLQVRGAKIGDGPDSDMEQNPASPNQNLPLFKWNTPR